MSNYELMRHPFQELVDDVQQYVASSGLSRYMLRSLVLSLHDARQRAKIGIYDRNQMPVLEPADFDNIKQALSVHGIPTSCEYSQVSIQPLELIPLQHQMYVDKVIDGIAREGRNVTRHLHNNPIFVTADMHILDGHHRWLCALMIAKKVQLPVYLIDDTTEHVLPILLEWSDKHHPRNA